MKDGDFAGFSVLQKKYGLVGVKIDAGQKSIVMINAGNDKPVEVERIPLSQDQIYFRIDCDFTGMNDAAKSLWTLNGKDEAKFSYSLDGKVWNPIGNILKMKYDIPHFMGYRYGLFNCATKSAGGYADFDFFRVSNKISEVK